jgi:hypothetical protein
MNKLLKGKIMLQNLLRDWSIAKIQGEYRDSFLDKSLCISTCTNVFMDCDVPYFSIVGERLACDKNIVIKVAWISYSIKINGDQIPYSADDYSPDQKKDFELGFEYMPAIIAHGLEYVENLMGLEEKEEGMDEVESKTVSLQTA